MLHPCFYWRRKLREDDRTRSCFDVARLSYNYKISNMRNNEYPMLKGTLHDHEPITDG